MDTMYFDLSDKVLPLTLQGSDTNSDIGPYDDDGDTRLYSIPDYEVDRLLKERKRLQTQKPKRS